MTEAIETRGPGRTAQIMANLSGVDTGRDRDEVAAYLAELTGELALVARRHGFDALAYLLDMAQLEAESVTRRPRSPDPKRSAARG